MTGAFLDVPYDVEVAARQSMCQHWRYPAAATPVYHDIIAHETGPVPTQVLVAVEHHCTDCGAKVPMPEDPVCDWCCKPADRFSPADFIADHRRAFCVCMPCKIRFDLREERRRLFHEAFRHVIQSMRNIARRHGLFAGPYL